MNNKSMESLSITLRKGYLYSINSHDPKIYFTRLTRLPSALDLPRGDLDAEPGVEISATLRIHYSKSDFLSISSDLVHADVDISAFKEEQIEESERLYLGISIMRKKLEELGWIMLCNFSRINAHRTLLAKASGNPLCISIVDREEPFKQHLVQGLEPASAGSVGSWLTQNKFRQHLPNDLF